MAIDEKPESDDASNMSGNFALDREKDIGLAEQNVDIEKQAQEQAEPDPAMEAKESEHHPNIVEFE
jgi:hypothetical protein